MSRISLALVVAGVLLGCSTGQDAPPPALTHGEVPRGCPLGVPGAHVAVADTADGIELSFVSPDRATEMRVRANDAAAQHGPGQGMGQGHGGKHGDGGDHGLQLMQAPPSHSAATDIEGGARIRFSAVDPADLDTLRAKLHARADHMNAATCP